MFSRVCTRRNNLEEHILFCVEMLVMSIDEQPLIEHTILY